MHFHSLIRIYGCRRKYFRSEIKKIRISFCISLTYSYLCSSINIILFTYEENSL